MVGRLARMRPSSPTRDGPSPEESSGTLRSDRTSTRRPATPSLIRSSRVRTGWGSGLSEPGADEGGEVDETARVTQLVGGPADDLDHVAADHGHTGVEGAGRRGADDVAG